MCSVEACVIVIDFFSFLLEPLIGPLLSYLRWTKKVDYCPKRPWLHSGQTAPTSLQGLHQEMIKFHEMHERKLRESLDFKSCLLDELRRVASQAHFALDLVQNELMDRQVNWIDYDFSLHISQQQTETNDTPERGDDEELTELQMLLDHSGESQYVHLKLGRSAQRPIGTAKLTTPDQLKLLSERSSFVFYYTQIHPELSNLYLIASSLLEFAQLLECSPTPDESSDAKQWQNCKLALSACNSALKLNKAPEQPVEGEEQYCSSTSERTRLDRYALLLMLAAYLDSAEAKGEQRSLAEHLIGFLSSFARDLNEKLGEQICVKPEWRKINENRSQFYLSLSLQRSKNGDCGGDKLVLLDPVSGCSLVGDSQAPLAALANRAANLADLTNLAPRRETVEAIRHLFSRLLVRLNNIDRSESCPSLLESLFTLSSGIVVNNNNSSNRSDSNGIKSSVGRAAASRKHLIDGSMFAASRQLSSSRLRLPWRRLLTNLLYVVLFLVARNLLLNNLERFRDDLKAQAREDFVQLKQHLSHGQDRGFATGMFSEEAQTGRRLSTSPAATMNLQSAPNTDQVNVGRANHLEPLEDAIENEPGSETETSSEEETEQSLGESLRSSAGKQDGLQFSDLMGGLLMDALKDGVASGDLDIQELIRAIMEEQGDEEEAGEEESLGDLSSLAGLFGNLAKMMPTDLPPESTEANLDDQFLSATEESSAQSDRIDEAEMDDVESVASADSLGGHRREEL